MTTLNGIDSDPAPDDPRPTESTGPEPIEPSEPHSAGGGDGPADPPDRPVAPHRRRRWQWRLGWAMVLVAVLAIGCAAWVGITGLKARDDLTYIADHAGQVRAQVVAGDFDAAVTTAQALAKRADRAHDLTTGPAWWVSSSVPGLGDPADTVRGVANAAHALASDVLPQAIDVMRKLNSTDTVNAAGTVDVAVLTRLTANVATILNRSRTVQEDVQSLPQRTWVSQADTARTRMLSAMDEVVSTMGVVSRALSIAPDMLGAAGPRRYFIGFLNSAELRGAGGLPGAFGILVVDNGKVSFSHFGTDNELSKATSSVDFGADFNTQYRDWIPTTQYLNSTVSANFPYAAQIWASMWERQSGEHIDGAIAVDPTALSYLLEASGPAQLPDGTAVSAANVVKLTQSDAYTKFGTDQNARKQFLLDVASAAEQKIVASTSHPLALIRAAVRAVSERRLLMWSADAKDQTAIATDQIGGVIPQTSAPYGFAVVNNTNASKLDYYLKASVDWARTGCGATRDVTVTVRFTLDAPTSGLPPYVTGGVTTGPIKDTLMLDYIATTGAVATKVTIDGAPVAVTVGTEQGHPVFRTNVTIPAGGSQTVVYHLREPAGQGSPRIDKQPLVHPVKVTTTDATCGG